MSVAPTLWNPLNWLPRASTQETTSIPVSIQNSIEDHSPELKVFAESLKANITLFDQKLITAFKETDIAITSASVDYLFKDKLGELEASFRFTNQNQGNLCFLKSEYNHLFLAHPICKALDYSNLDEATHIKIDNFVRKFSNLFSGSYAGVVFENSKGSTNLTKIDVVVQDNFAFNPEAVSNGVSALEIEAKIRAFQEGVKIAEVEFKKIFSKNAIQNEPALIPSALKSKLPKKLIKSPLIKPRVTSKVAESPVIETNVKATDVVAKQPIFNSLFANEPGEHKFSMTDLGLRFEVEYKAKATEFTISGAILFNVPFAVVKKYQDAQRQFCVENSPLVNPKGTLEIQQRQYPTGLFTQYVAETSAPITDSAEILQDKFNNYRASQLVLLNKTSNC